MTEIWIILMDVHPPVNLNKMEFVTHQSRTNVMFVATDYGSRQNYVMIKHRMTVRVVRLIARLVWLHGFVLVEVHQAKTYVNLLLGMEFKLAKKNVMIWILLTTMAVHLREKLKRISDVLAFLQSVQNVAMARSRTQKIVMTQTTWIMMDVLRIAQLKLVLNVRNNHQNVFQSVGTESL